MERGTLYLDTQPIVAETPGNIAFGPRAWNLKLWGLVALAFFPHPPDICAYEGRNALDYTTCFRVNQVQILRCFHGEHTHSWCIWIIFGNPMRITRRTRTILRIWLQVAWHAAT